jgi:hypothetical protein
MLAVGHCVECPHFHTLRCKVDGCNAALQRTLLHCNAIYTAWLQYSTVIWYSVLVYGDTAYYYLQYTAQVCVSRRHIDSYTVLGDILHSPLSCTAQ